MSEVLPEGFTMPICNALTEPKLYAGVPPGPCAANGVLCAITVIGFHWWVMLLVCVGFHYALKQLTKHDPYWQEVLLRHLHYRSYYEA